VNASLPLRPPPDGRRGGGFPVSLSFHGKHLSFPSASFGSAIDGGSIGLKGYVPGCRDNCRSVFPLWGAGFFPPYCHPGKSLCPFHIPYHTGGQGRHTPENRDGSDVYPLNLRSFFFLLWSLVSYNVFLPPAGIGTSRSHPVRP